MQSLPFILKQAFPGWYMRGARPTFCLIGREGLLYACVPGETDLGGERANKIKSAIELLLKAPAS